MSAYYFCETHQVFKQDFIFIYFHAVVSCNFHQRFVKGLLFQTDIFCMQRLIKLAPDSNPFLRIVFRPPMFEPEFWVNKNVWVEIYYTENVPLNWGRFDAITATGAGTSRVGGLPHNKVCSL